jgi:nucleotide-binding universal stress UspA family protein
MFQHLLIPIDGSERSQRAVATAIALARKLGAVLTAFIVEPPVPVSLPGHGAAGIVRRLEQHDHDTAAHAQHLLQAAITQAERAGVRCDGFYLRNTQIVPAILDAARERGCDLIVMATHVHGAFAEWLSPSHTKGVMARSDLALLVVH